MKINIKLPNEVNVIHRIFRTEGFELFLVGGAVRDAVLGVTPKDFDLVTNAVPEKVIELLKPQKFVTNILETGRIFGVINVITNTHEFEIATMRQDKYLDGEAYLESFKNYLKLLNNGSFENFTNGLMK